jgi:hypothetical protein
MADLTITAANVIAGAGAKKTGIKAGGTITQGKALYRKSDGTYDLADADVLATAGCAGVALNAASAGQDGIMQTYGRIAIGGTVAVGTVYVVSATAGGICPIADLVTGDYVCEVGRGVSVTEIFLTIDPNVPLVLKP